jgi:hypothetical protein
MIYNFYFGWIILQQYVIMQQTLECNKHLEFMEIKYEGFIFL